jgi:hypothetical protein
MDKPTHTLETKQIGLFGTTVKTELRQKHNQAIPSPESLRTEFLRLYQTEANGPASTNQCKNNTPSPARL